MQKKLIPKRLLALMVTSKAARILNQRKVNLSQHLSSLTRTEKLKRLMIRTQSMSNLIRLVHHLIAIKSLRSVM